MHEHKSSVISRCELLRNRRKTTSVFAFSRRTPTRSPEYRGEEAILFRPSLGRFLAATVVCWLAAAGGTQTATAGEALRDPTLVQRENAKPGATDWQLTRVRLDKIDGFRCPWIEGYCSKQSVQAGESLDIMVSTDPPVKFKIEIFRTGYYGGRGARLMTTLGPSQGAAQPIPPRSSSPARAAGSCCGC